jgi:hypothetical protein
MDILYYSNYCKHSKNILLQLVKYDIVKKLNCICVDQRKVNPKTGQTYVILENGTQILLPPNVHSVPALLLVQKNYNVLLGDAIMDHFQNEITERQTTATKGQGEPIGMSLGSKDIVSEQYTFFNASSDDLSAKSTSTNRQLHHYVSVNDDSFTISTPPDTYRPNKLSENVTIENLQKIRNDEMPVADTSPFHEIPRNTFS